MNKSEALYFLRKELNNLLIANSCGISNNDFKNQIEKYSNLIDYIENKGE